MEKISARAEAIVGMGMDGDACIYVAWVDNETGNHIRFLAATELERLLAENKPIPTGRT